MRYNRDTESAEWRGQDEKMDEWMDGLVDKTLEFDTSNCCLFPISDSQSLLLLTMP